MLDEDRGRDDRLDSVAALATVADAVTVDFVDDVAFVGQAVIKP